MYGNVSILLAVICLLISKGFMKAFWPFENLETWRVVQFMGVCARVASDSLDPIVGRREHIRHFYSDMFVKAQQYEDRLARSACWKTAATWGNAAANHVVRASPRTSKRTQTESS